MNIKTPEKYWERFKKDFLPNCPRQIDDHVKEGFKDSEDQSEKWMKLLLTIAMIRKHSDKLST